MATELERSEGGWTRWVILWIVFLAVATALASQQHSAFGARSVRALNNAAIEQGLATNHWSWYQAASVKLHMYEFEKERIADAQESPGPGTATATPVRAAMGAGAAKKAGASLDEKIRKYEQQKSAIREKAKSFERARDELRAASKAAQRHGTELTLAIAILQVAIAVASIAALARKKPLWFVSMVLGTFGIFQTFNGIFLWV
jgi:hypothetical protein